MRLGWLAAALALGHVTARGDSGNDGGGGTDLAAWAFAPPSVLARKVDRLVRASERAMRRGEHEEVARKLGIAIQLDPTRADAAYGRALALSFLGRNDEARALLRQAQDLDPYMDPWILSVLADLEAKSKGRSMTHIFNTPRVQDGGSTVCDRQVPDIPFESNAHAIAIGRAAQAAQAAQEFKVGLAVYSDGVKRHPTSQLAWASLDDWVVSNNHNVGRERNKASPVYPYCSPLCVRLPIIRAKLF